MRRRERGKDEEERGRRVREEEGVRGEREVGESEGGKWWGGGWDGERGMRESS